LGSAYIIQAFGAIIVGGMGNIRGTFLACILLGLINAFGIILIPDIPGILFYVALAAMILIRPQGLLGVRS
jgi:branched-chain amino acid transport system permease protein